MFSSILSQLCSFGLAIKSIVQEKLELESEEKGGAGISRLPEEICHDILLRLPVRSLLDCKCVCKNWYALISDSDFVKTHIAIQQNQNPRLMLEGLGISNQLYSIGCDSLESLCKINEDVTRMDHPFESLGYHVGLLGSINGIVTLVDLRLCDAGSDRGFICLWNPATREYLKIPESPIEYHRWSLCGFGYDHNADDYKFIIGTGSPEGGANSRISTLVKVYSLASNSWTTGKTIPYSFSGNQLNGLIFNGDLHWLGEATIEENKCLLLVSLDVSDQIFKQVHLPKELLEINEIGAPFLGVLEGCICVLDSSFSDAHFHVWKMVDYGVPESWTKRYAIAHEGIVCSYLTYLSIRLVLSFENGELIFTNSYGLVLYDPKDGSTRKLKSDDLQFWKADTYFESLVSLNSGTYVEGEKSTVRYKINRTLKKIF